MNKSIKITFRSFKKKPVIPLINLLGLALSLSLVIMLSIYCYHELTTDSHQVNGESVFLLNNENEENVFGAIQPGILKEHIDLHIPNIEAALRIRKTWLPPVYKAPSGSPIKSELIYVDESFFDFFTYQVISGNLENALKTPMSLILLKPEAIKIFGTEDVIGQTVKYNNEYIFTVGAVIDQPKGNTCLHVKALTSMASLRSVRSDYSEADFTNWEQRNFLTFVKLKNKDQQVETVNRIINLFPKESREGINLKLTPLNKIYRTPCGVNTPYLTYIKQGNIARVLLFLTIAFLILIIALINYINISSSGNAENEKLTSVQKVIGASRLNIFFRIIMEGQYTFLGAAVLAVFITLMINPYVNQFAGIGLNTAVASSPGFYITMLLATILIGLLAGFFPAVRFSSIHPFGNSKGLIGRNKIGGMFRKVLVISQFVIAVILISFTILVQKQVKYGCTELGFDNENILAIKINEQLLNKQQVLKDQLLSHSLINDVSFAQFYPGKVLLNHNDRSFRFKNGENRVIPIRSMDADASFLHMMGLELINGRFFSDDFTADKGKVIVNESFLKKNKIMTDPIGAVFQHGQYNSEIVGVIKDFHFDPVNKAISPMIITNSRPNHLFCPLYCLVKVQADDFSGLHATYENTKEIFTTLSPDYPVEISFMDNAIENMYKREIHFRQAFSLFAGSAIFISCLGIFALSLIATQRKIKEVGIRKVNGARISEILTMLNKDFIKSIIIAFVIACPIAYYAMNKWLENFAYKTNLSWWIFALAGVLALGIALFTVSFQSYKAATRNPIEALRYE